MIGMVHDVGQTFKFAKVDVERLQQVLGIPERVVTIQRIVCNGLEALCILLKRLAYPCRFSDLLEETQQNYV